MKFYQGYGNYCGPWWSDGKIQTSVIGNTVPIDELDSLCMTHDAAHYEGTDLQSADYEFATRAITMGPYGAAFGSAVAIQYAGRGVKNQLSKSFSSLRNIMGSSKAPKNKPINQTQKGGSFRGSPLKRKAGNAMAERVLMSMEDRNVNSIGGVQVSAPTSISSVLTAMPTKTRSIQNGVIVSGREFISTVEGNGVSTFGVGKSALLAPAYFYGGVLGQLARAYQFYKWTHLVVHYIPKVSTGTSGQVVICSQDNITEPFMCPEASTMLQRAMVSGNGVMTPAWMPAKMMIQTDNVKRYVDATTNIDINSNIFAELQVLTQVGTSQNLGYLWLEYIVELTHPMLQPHLTTLPYFTGPGQRYIFNDATAINAPDAPVLLVDTTGSLVLQPNGTIFRAVLDIQGSTPGVGTTFANAWNVTTLRRTTNTTFASALSNMPIVGGMTFYLAACGPSFTIHTSLESATGGLTSGEVVQRSASTAVGSWEFDIALVRSGVAILPTVQ